MRMLSRRPAQHGGFLQEGAPGQPFTVQKASEGVGSQ